jgi:hypothetical protein
MDSQRAEGAEGLLADLRMASEPRALPYQMSITIDGLEARLSLNDFLHLVKAKPLPPD